MIERRRDEQKREIEVLVFGIAASSTILAFDFRRSEESRPQIITLPFEQKLDMFMTIEDLRDVRKREVYRAVLARRAMLELKDLRPEIEGESPVFVEIVDWVGDLVRLPIWIQLRRFAKGRALSGHLGHLASELLKKE